MEGVAGVWLLMGLLAKELAMSATIGSGVGAEHGDD
jgi:hypothetical protein